MPRFFFDFDGVIDTVGLEFADLNTACFEARRAMPDVAKEKMSKNDGKTKEHWTCRVRQETGDETMRLTFRLLIENRGKDCAADVKKD